ncbi:MAG: EcoKI restriction-modification system protein HsdS [Bacteroidetes bacterium ADurb.Bin174]|nr:MAG: EcoKI restriction-modification system protein HsdS [Bacteroidetes bacterium ADurb.Bin174]
MSKWSKKKIKDFAFTASGGTPSTERKEYWHNGTIPWINSGELSKHDIIKKPTTYITQEALDNSSAKLFPIGTVVIALTGATTGMSAILEIETSTNQSITGIFPSKEHDSKFLLYTLHHNIDKILLHNVGSAQPHINKEIVDNLEFNYPIVPEQYVISKILSTADAVIEKTQAAIAKYKAIKQGMLQDLFTRGIDLNTNKLRPRYQDAPELYKEGKLGWIPREWEDKSIESIGEIVTGSTPPTARAEYYGDAFLFVSPADIQDNFFIQETGKKLTQSGFDVTRKLPVNSICVVCIGSTIGKMALLAKEGCTNQQINSVICHDPELSFYFFYAMMFYNEPQFRRETGLQAVPIVNKSQFSEFLLPVAEKTEALKIAERLKAIDNKLQTEQTYLQKIQSLKKGLMEDLLSGRKQVKVAEEVLTLSEN